MKSFLYMTLIFFLGLTGCMQTISSINPEFKIEKKSLNLQPSVSIAVITNDWEWPDQPQIWYKVIDNKYLKKLENIPDTYADYIGQFEISPNDEFMAVLSGEEGIPCLSIFQVDDLFAKRKKNEDKKIDHIAILCPVCSVNSEMKLIFSGWENDNVLIIESDYPLDEIKKIIESNIHNTLTCEAFENIDPCPQSEYLWDVLKDTIVRR